MPAKFSNISPDVILHIISHAVPGTPHPRRNEPMNLTALHISQVSRSLRHILITSPTAWSTIQVFEILFSEFDDDRGRASSSCPWAYLVELYLDRSADSRLRIFLDHIEALTEQELTCQLRRMHLPFGKLLAQASRWIALDGAPGTQRWESPMWYVGRKIQYLALPRFEQLQELAVDSRHLGQLLGDSSHKQVARLGGLRILEVSNHIPHNRHNLGSLYRIIRPMQNLEHLALQLTGISRRPYHVAPRTTHYLTKHAQGGRVELPKLHNLRLGQFNTAHRELLLLSCFSFPNLHSVSFHGAATSIPRMLTIGDSCVWTHLRSLHLELALRERDGTTLISSISSMIGLESLSMRLETTFVETKKAPDRGDLEGVSIDRLLNHLTVYSPSPTTDESANIICPSLQQLAIHGFLFTPQALLDLLTSRHPSPVPARAAGSSRLSVFIRDVKITLGAGLDIDTFFQDAAHQTQLQQILRGITLEIYDGNFTAEQGNLMANYLQDFTGSRSLRNGRSYSEGDESDETIPTLRSPSSTDFSSEESGSLDTEDDNPLANTQ